MIQDPKGKSWRPNAAAVILSTDGKVLLGKDAGRNTYWHFPQGGAVKGETIEHALAREVWEEVGLRPGDYIIAKTLSGLRYKYPENNSKSGKWIGQEQTYFLLICKKDNPKTSVNRSPEFSKIRWFDRKELKLNLFPKFKRSVIKKVLDEFFPSVKLTAPSKSPLFSEAQHIYPINQSLPVMDRYLVPAGIKLNLKDYAPDNKSLFSGSKEEALIEFDTLNKEFQELQRKMYAENKHRILVVFQAMDAGGKDGCIRNVFSGIDPQGLRVVPFKKPTADELAHDYLWRIHREVPGNGQIAVFNRSHYEDIIAVKVKRIFPDEVWKRRYRSVIDFEHMLASEGTEIIKIFLNISKGEQKARLEGRLRNPDKVWKFQMDDLDDRNRWDEFQGAYRELIEATSFQHAPWYIIPADRKWYRNLIVTRILVEKLRSLNCEYPQLSFDPSTIRVND